MPDSKQAAADTAPLLQRLDDERAIVDRLYEYAHSMDHGPEERLRDCFTEDRVLERRWQGVFEGTTSGNTRSRPWTRTPNTKHLIACPRITSLNGQEATVESYWTYVIEGGDSPHIQSFGRYLDHMKRASDGKWRISQRVIDVEGRSAARRMRATSS